MTVTSGREMLRVISEARPDWVLGENVAGIINLELDRCISDLETAGYSVQAFIIPACAVDAKHRRNRVWIAAHSADAGRNRNDAPGNDARQIAEDSQQQWNRRASGVKGCSQNVADAGSSRGGGGGAGMKPETRGKKLHIEVRLWPTPKATLRGDCISERNRHSPDKDGGGAKSCMNVPVNGLLGRAIHQKDNPQPGQLNPTFVEWLMGYPCGHTELSLSEMQSFRKSRSKSLKQSRKQNETNP